MSPRVPIGPGTRVMLYFTIKLAGGDIVDSTKDKPAMFTVGDGNLLPGFERAMFGLRAGSSVSLELTADEAFGPSNPDNFQMMKRTDFGQDIELSEGLMVSFADKQNTELPGIVNRILGDIIEVDFNHPLAGRDIVFDVEIITVEQISNEIAKG
ncbi:MAG: peptidylprolyl isomerase [Pseudomonadales bacterium]